MMSTASKTDIWMPLYIADYLASTTRLTTEQHGAYMLLIMDYWKNGRLPDNDSILSSITRMTRDTWDVHKGVLRGFFEVSNGEWIHSRIEKELSKSEANRLAQIKRSILGNYAKYGKVDERVSSDPELKEWWSEYSLKESLKEPYEECPKDPPSPSPSPSPLTKPSVITPATAPSAEPQKKSSKGSRLPDDWFLPKSWGDWALAERPDLSIADIKKQADCFRDYWVSVPGAKGVKADWEATWRNWIRRVEKRAQGAASSGGFASAMEYTRNQILGGGKNGNGFTNEAIDITPTGAGCRGIESF